MMITKMKKMIKILNRIKINNKTKLVINSPIKIDLCICYISNSYIFIKYLIFNIYFNHLLVNMP